MSQALTQTAFILKERKLVSYYTLHSVVVYDPLKQIKQQIGFYQISVTTSTFVLQIKDNIWINCQQLT